ncbi:MAG: hypothetical protein HYR84_02825 [Planctomycetes bacterium]|nr:hypothetical protein [Planctomycetota bacterium]
MKPESSGGPLRGDEYFGQPLQTVVREVLVSRKSSNLGPASVAEIYSAMLGGGYQFESRDEENAKRGLRISLTKNSATFTKLPGGKYGLREWYPAIKDSKPRANQKETGTDATEETADDFDFEAKEAANAESK